MSETKATRNAFGEALRELGKENKDIVVLDADLSKSTMTDMFREACPERHFNIGIAEQNMAGMAAGMSLTGKIPFFATFAIFASGRIYDQIRNGICYPKLNVKIAGTHAGLTVGEDGGSHQALEDIALMRVIPNMVVLSPCDAVETEKAVRAAAQYQGPVYLRLARPATAIVTKADTPFQIGKALTLKHGKDICIFATGILVPQALEAAEILEAKGHSVSVINIHTIKPIDEEAIVSAAKNHKHLVSVEEHNIIGGFGSAIAEVLVKYHPMKLDMIGVNDTFGESGTPDELLKAYKLDAQSIAARISSSIK